MSHKFRFKRRETVEQSFGINVIPMIDLVTILNAFLLVSASFFAFGQIQVEVPYLSSKAPPTEDKSKNSLSINIEMKVNEIEIQVRNSRDLKADQAFTIAKQGEDYEWKSFHDKLIEIKKGHPEITHYTLFPDEEIDYQSIVSLLDHSRSLEAGDPPLSELTEDGTEVPATSLYKNVVMGGVLF